MGTNRGCQGFLNYPASLKPLRNGRFRDIVSNRPIFKEHSLACQGQGPVVSSIPGLFFCCRPTAIFWAIIAIIVNTIKAMRRAWALTHISKKALKIKPSVTDGDSSAAVIFIVDSIRVKASAFHSSPDTIFWGIYQTVIFGFLNAATTLYFGISEARHRSSKFSPAMAPATVMIFVTRGVYMGNRQNQYPSKSLAAKICVFRHSLIIPQYVRITKGVKKWQI